MVRIIGIIAMMAIPLIFLGCSDSSTDSGNGPAAPTGLIGEMISPTKISLKWYDNSTDETGFKIYRNSILGYDVIAIDIADVTSYIDTFLQEAMLYTYYVMAYNERGISGASNLIQLTTATSFSSAFYNPAPGNNSIISPDIHPFELLRWTFTTNNEDSVNFNVYFGTTYPLPLVASNISKTEFQTGELSYNQTYYWNIIARDSNGRMSEGPIWTFHNLHCLALRSTIDVCIDRLTLVSNLLYAISMADTLITIDMSSPDSPFIAGKYAAGSPLADIAIIGDRCYAIGWAGWLKILDLTDPMNPFLIGSFQDTLHYVFNRIAVSGNYAYIQCHCPPNYSKLLTFDVSNEVEPTMLTSVPSPPMASNMIIDGNYLYMTFHAFDSTMEIINITNPTSPRISYNYGSHSVYDLAICADRVYLGTDDYAIIILDVTDHENPAVIGRHQAWGETYGISVNGDYAYLANSYANLDIINISNLSNITLSARYDEVYCATDVEVSGQYVYLADRMPSSSISHLKIFEYIE